MELRNEVLKVTRAFSHRLTSAPESRKIEFARSMIDRIKTIENKIPTIDLTGEKAYFNKILGE